MSSWRQDRSILCARVLAYLTGGIATLSLAGWASHIPVLTTFVPGAVSMKVNTSLGFLLLACALHTAVGGLHTRSQAILASLASLLGCFTLFEYITGLQLGIDELLIHDPEVTVHPGRMSPITALNFMLLGVALLPLRQKASEVVREGLSLLAVLTSMFAIVGYLYRIPLLYGATSSSSTPMAIHTGATFLLLALGFLLLPREHGVVRIFRGNSIASMVARFLVPVAIVVPIGLGAIFMHDRLNRGHLPLAMALSVVSTMVLLVALIWYFSFAIQRTEMERTALRQQAQTDSLTGIYNRCYFDISLEHEVERSRRYGTPLSLIMFDLDHFKVLNDLYGHLTGDRALFRVARLCEQHLRATDVFCRYGGEEFAIITPETTPVAAMTLARRIREDVGTVTLDRHKEAITISAGVAAWDSHFLTKEDLIAAADQALYEAKSSGRNCERLYGDGHSFTRALTSDPRESGASAS